MSPFSGEDEDSLYRSIQYDRVQYLKMDSEAKDFCMQVCNHYNYNNFYLF